VILGEMTIGMIVKIEQVNEVEVILAKETNDNEAVPRDIWAP